MRNAPAHLPSQLAFSVTGPSLGMFFPGKFAVAATLSDNSGRCYRMCRADAFSTLEILCRAVLDSSSWSDIRPFFSCPVPVLYPAEMLNGI